MNSDLLYQWTETVDKQFPSLGRWQALTLALFSFGLVLAKQCRLSEIAKHVRRTQSAESLERQLQRWLANRRIEMTALFPYWIGWVLSKWGQAPLLVLVDETKLGQHVAVMVVSAYYQHNAIPLIWRAYDSAAYPEEGQVALLSDLLARLRAALPAQTEALLLADRGLGTSPAWQDALTELGWDYLLRVQGTTHIRLADGKAQPLRRLVGYGGQWFGRGEVFKKAGWRRQTVFVLWGFGYAEPWCLVSNRADATPTLYAWRFHHESSFRDLKSDGFDWHKSRIWQPEHVERLLLALALALFWTLATGTQVWHLYPLSKRRQRLSLFRLGLDVLFDRLRATTALCLELYFTPDTPPLKTVVL